MKIDREFTINCIVASVFAVIALNFALLFLIVVAHAVSLIFGG